MLGRRGYTLTELLFALLAVTAVGIAWGLVKAQWGFWAGILAGGIVAMACAVMFFRFTERRVRKEDYKIGDPTSNYLALLMFDVSQAYERLQEHKVEESKHEMVNILASYSSFLTMKQNLSESEQRTLDAIARLCEKSEALGRTVDVRCNEVRGKSTDQILEELEKEFANNDLNLFEQSADSSKG